MSRTAVSLESRQAPQTPGRLPSARPATPVAGSPPGQLPALEENVEAIKSWEQSLFYGRSSAEQISNWITSTASSGPVLLAHVLWFASWTAVNNGWIPGVAPFDPFPFPILTMTVSLEAIFLALFVLASQNRLARESDKRAHLNLQIDLLTEREMTAVLQLLKDIASHLDVKGTVTPEQLRDLVKKTDIHSVAEKLEDLPDPGTGGGAGNAEGITEGAGNSR